jgi:hypothetical protein
MIKTHEFLKMLEAAQRAGCNSIGEVINGLEDVGSYNLLTPVNLESVLRSAPSQPPPNPIWEGINQMLFDLLDETNAQLKELAPYNGTPQGAQAVGEARTRRDHIEATIKERGAVR